MASRAPVFASPRVAPLATYAARDRRQRPEGKQLHHSSQLRLQLQWVPAAKMQLLLFRNTIICVVAAVLTNGCFYSGNVFSLKSSTQQSRPEFLMALLIWTVLCYAAVMIASHLPSLMTQRFLKFPERKPSLWFCTKKLIRRSSPYFAATVAGMIGLGLLVQKTSLMHEHFQYKLHFYLGDVCNLVFTAGIALAVRQIYYEETRQGHSRRLTLHDISEPRTGASSPPRRAHPPPRYHSPSFWREYFAKLPHCLMIAMAGGYVHVVSSYRIFDRGTVVIMGFSAFGLGLKLASQEVARWYVHKKRIRSIRTMCVLVGVLVGVPTVLIDTQTRLVLLGTQTNSFLVSGTFAMAAAELGLRVAKAAFVMWTIRRKFKALEEKLQELVARGAPGPSSLKLEFQLWRRQVVSYHTAELTADMYAEYIAIGCSQSIVFWYVGHPFYPALQLESASALSEIDMGRWRFNEVAMLAFQFVVEFVVDYVCVVLEMAAGIDFDRIQGLGTFLGVLFMTMAVLNINISSAVYLS